MLHFRIGPFPVRVDLSFLIMAVLLGGLGMRSFFDTAAWVAIVFVSVLVHELGHAVVGLAQGGSPEIVLQGMGGVTFPRLRTRIGWPQQILLSIAGPIAGLLPGVAALGFLISQHRTLWGDPRLLSHLMRLTNAVDPLDRTLATLLEMSVIWTALNLMPVLPLDGGHVLETALGAFAKKPQPVLASWISAAAAILLGIATYPLFGWFTALFFGYLAFGSIARARALARGGPVVGQRAAPDAAARSQVAEALQKARAAISVHDYNGARAAADSLDLSPDPFCQAGAARIRAGIALADGQYLEAGRQAGRAYSIAPSPDAAVVAARAALRGGDKQVAQNWLKRALEAGAPLAAIRDDAELGVLIG